MANEKTEYFDDEGPNDITKLNFCPSPTWRDSSLFGHGILIWGWRGLKYIVALRGDCAKRGRICDEWMDGVCGKKKCEGEIQIYGLMRIGPRRWQERTSKKTCQDFTSRLRVPQPHRDLSHTHTRPAEPPLPHPHPHHHHHHRYTWSAACGA